MSVSFGEIGCVVTRDNGKPCGGYGQPTELEDGRTIQACSMCRAGLGPIRKVYSNYPYPVTSDDVHRYALDLIKRYVDAGHDDPERLDIGAGSGPSRRDRPAYRYEMGAVAVGVKRGYLRVALGERGEAIECKFKIADLVREVRSGATQLDMFGGLA